MATLSNLLGFRSDGAAAWQVRTVGPAELDAAMALLAGTRPNDEAAIDLRAFATRRGAELSAMPGVFAGPTLRWTVLPIPAAGGVLMLLLPPTALAAAGTDAAVSCLKAVCDDWHHRGGRLVQSLLTPDATTAAELLREAGFRYLAELLYLHRPLRKLAPPPLPAGTAVSTYSARTHDRFADAIRASYIDSLDCPGLGAHRTMDEILAGHRAAGVFDPTAWFVLNDGAGDVGVLLLNGVADARHMDLAYLGVTPRARGKGFGDWLVRLALHTAQSRGLDTLTVAVDSNNAPAIRLYQRHGMRRQHSRHAYVRELGAGL